MAVIDLTEPELVRDEPEEKVKEEVEAEEVEVEIEVELLADLSLLDIEECSLFSRIFSVPSLSIFLPLEIEL